MFCVVTYPRSRNSDSNPYVDNRGFVPSTDWTLGVSSVTGTVLTSNCLTQFVDLDRQVRVTMGLMSTFLKSFLRIR